MRQNLLVICIISVLFSNRVSSASNPTNTPQSITNTEEVSAPIEQADKQDPPCKAQTEKDKAKYKESPEVYVSNCCPGMGSYVLNGRAINLIQPEYPEAARKTRASGQVSVQVLVNKRGKVISATAVSGNPLLRSSARDAALKSTFKRVLNCGKFVKNSGTVIFNFTAK